MDSSITSKRKRVVSGMRPTGRLHVGHYFGALENWVRLHVGHYFGALENWVRLQADPEYDCFYFIADWHAGCPTLGFLGWGFKLLCNPNFIDYKRFNQIRRIALGLQHHLKK